MGQPLGSAQGGEIEGFDANRVVDARLAAGLIVCSGDPVNPHYLLLKRPAHFGFAGGHHVFPGGAVDSADLSTLPAESPADYDCRCAALRECWEETGCRELQPLFDRAADPRSLQRHALDLQHFVSWTTPKGVRKRFNARFYLWNSPSTYPVATGPEVDEARWLTAPQALEQAERGEIQLMFPTLKTFELLARLGTWHRIVEYAMQLPLDFIEPEITNDDSGIRISLPAWFEQALR